MYFIIVYRLFINSDNCGLAVNIKQFNSKTNSNMVFMMIVERSIGAFLQIFIVFRCICITSDLICIASRWPSLAA